MTRTQLIAASTGGASVCTVLAVGITVLRFRSLRPLAVSRSPIGAQIAVGLAAGALLGATAVALFLRARLFEPGRAKARAVLESAHPTWFDFCVMSLAAGFGEELLFRATLQPLVGLWLSTFLFVLVHYWVPLTGVARVCYALVVVAASLSLGLLYARLGPAAAMTAHAAFDLVVLLVAARSLGVENRLREESS